MSTMRVVDVGAFQDAIAKEVIGLERLILDGRVDDFTGYKFLVGERKGMIRAQAALITVLKDMDERED